MDAEEAFREWDDQPWAPEYGEDGPDPDEARRLAFMAGRASLRPLLRQIADEILAELKATD